MPKQSILVVDREPDFLEWAKHQLEGAGARVLTEDSADAAYKTFCMENPDVVMAEMNLHPFSGLDLLAKVRKQSQNTMVIIISAFGTNQNVIEAMKMGAFDFVRKEQLPFNLKIVADAALKASAELKAANTFKPVLTVEQYQDEIVGKSDAMQQVFKMIGRVAASDAPVMVTGESGSGKELVARAIHNYSSRSNKSFLAINCAAIPENLLESELFGHEKGSFTGPTASASDGSSSLTTARCFWMRSAKCHCRFKARSSASFRKGNFPVSAATRPSAPTCASSVRRTRFLKKR